MIVAHVRVCSTVVGPFPVFPYMLTFEDYYYNYSSVCHVIRPSWIRLRNKLRIYFTRLFSNKRIATVHCKEISRTTVRMQVSVAIPRIRAAAPVIIGLPGAPTCTLANARAFVAHALLDLARFSPNPPVAHRMRPNF